MTQNPSGHNNTPNNDSKEGGLSYLYETYTDRERLVHNFELSRFNFNTLFDQALGLAHAEQDPTKADWTVLDVGCGEGLFAEEIVTRYPHACVIGFDRDREAIATAKMAFGSRGALHFFTHDVNDPLPLTDWLIEAKGEGEGKGKSKGKGTQNKAGGQGQGQIDVVVAWTFLMHIKKLDQALGQLYTSLRPGGTLISCDPPNPYIIFPHPSLNRLVQLTIEAMNLISAGPIGEELPNHLAKAGFVDIESQVIEYPLGGPGRQGQATLNNILHSLQSSRRGLVEVLKLMSGEEFDHHLELIRRTATPQMEGVARVVQNLARKPKL